MPVFSVYTAGDKGVKFDMPNHNLLTAWTDWLGDRRKADPFVAQDKLKQQIAVYFANIFAIVGNVPSASEGIQQESPVLGGRGPIPRR